MKTPLILLLAAATTIAAPAVPNSEEYLVCVSNERDGTVSIMDPQQNRAIATIPVGKRPRGIHASPDGKWLYVAVSGTPIAGPPKRDAQGNVARDDDDEKEADHSADGIAVVDVAARKVTRKLPAGTDPEQFAVSPDGLRLYIANEDAGKASILNIQTAQVEQTIAVKDEPEGVGISPDGRWVYVTCEAGGEVVVVDTASHRAVAEIQVGGRPRSAAFLPDSTRAFVPSETAAQVHVIDTSTHRALRAIDLPKGSMPMHALITADGKTLLVSNGRGSTVSVIDPVQCAVVGTIPVGARAWGMALSPDERFLYVANGPSNDISKVDVSARKEAARLPAGASPWGVAIVPKQPTTLATKAGR